MSIGAPSNLGTLLIQRLDAVLGTTLGQQANLVSGARPSAVTQPGNAENPDALRNPTARHPREAVDAAGAQGRDQASIGKAAGATALDDRIGRAATYQTATSSAPTTLGFAARIILALLAKYPQAQAAIQGRTPLLDGQTTRPATFPMAGSPVNASAAWAALAGSLDQPGALAARLTQALGQAVQGSGLFYESHLAALSFGKASAQDLAREPQARLGQALLGAGGNPAQGALPAGIGAQNLQALMAAYQAATTQMAQTGQAAPQQGGPFPQAGTAANHQPGQSGAAANNPPGQASMTANTQATPFGQAGQSAIGQSIASQPGQSSQATLSATNPATSPHAAGAQSAHAAAAQAVIPGIDPQAQLLVRQQLEVLAHQAFAWQGEAWPGADMHWEIQRRPEGGDTGDAEPHWATRLSLSLPSLGEVHARLTLVGDQLVMRLAAPQAATQLGDDLETLRARLLAHGLQASQISVVNTPDDADPEPGMRSATPTAETPDAPDQA